MPFDFADLGRALDSFADQGRTAAFWWRDDDAVRPTPALARLLDLSDAFEIEVGVAVIPAAAEASLGDALAARPRAIVLQHGYAHKNHGAKGAPAVELGGARPLAQILEELGAGRRRLDALFAARAERIVAAPWNRIERPVLAALAKHGFRGASAYGPRASMAGAGALVVANAHVDPIDWRERRFAGEAKALSAIIGELEARRTGSCEPDEPLGLLTHHIDHDAALWAFLARFLAATRAHPAARWLTIGEAFAAPSPAVAPPVRVAP
jgi:hypothetical protein